MLEKIRRAVIPGLITVVAAYGISFAATGSVNPMNLVSSDQPTEVEVPPDAIETPETTESTDPAETPEAKEEATDEAAEPESSDDAHGVERSTDGCSEGFTGNHGEFVSQSDDHQAAAHSNCGKPVKAVEHQKVEDENEAETEDETEPVESPETEHAGGGSDNGTEHSSGHGPND